MKHKGYDKKLLALQNYYDEHGVLPSYSYMANLIGYKSKSAVHTFVEQLKSTGHLDLTPEQKLKPGKMFQSLVEYCIPNQE